MVKICNHEVNGMCYAGCMKSDFPIPDNVKSSLPRYKRELCPYTLYDVRAREKVIGKELYIKDCNSFQSVNGLENYL